MTWVQTLAIVIFFFIFFKWACLKCVSEAHVNTNKIYSLCFLLAILHEFSYFLLSTLLKKMQFNKNLPFISFQY